MLITKYLCRELAQGLCAIVGVLLLIVFSNMFVHYLNISAASAILNTSVFKMMASFLPQYLSMLLPIGLFLSILWVYGKLFADNELLVMFACGFSWRKLLNTTLLPAVFILVIVSAFALLVNPMMSAYQDALSDQDSAAKSNISLIKPGRIQSFNSGRQIVYIGQSDSKTGIINDLVMFQSLDSGKMQIVMAPSGHQQLDPSGAVYVVLDNGRQYQGVLGQKDMQIVQFGSFAQLLKGVSVNGESTDVGSVSTLKLLSMHDSEAQAELQWRLSAPISVMVLTLLGVVLCYVPPRTGRFFKLLPALLLFIIYFNLLSVSRSWVERGVVSPWLGVWWVHGVFFIAALIALWRMDSKRGGRSA